MTGPATEQQKAGLREEIRLHRQEIPAAERSVLDQAINEAVLAHVRETGVTSLAAFWPFDGEPDIRPALHELAAGGVEIALSVLEAESDPPLSMHRWQPETIMRINRFRIAEPEGEPQLDLMSLDIMLIPVVAWDRQGGRLGMGAGYYDRLLEPLMASEVPLRMALAYGLQEVAFVPMAELDVPMHGVICEHGWTLFDI